MNAFQFYAASSLSDAVDAFRSAPDARYLAGGQSLIPAMKLRLTAADRLVSLGALSELQHVTVTATDVTIGAMVPHAVVAAHPEIHKAIPALARLAGGIGDQQIRTLGTLGGSLAHADPAACYPAAVLALGATIRTDRRHIGADAFFLGLYETALAPGELIVEVQFPRPRRAAYEKFKHPASRFALVGVFVAQTAAGVRVAVTGAASHVFRVAALERALSADFSPAAARAVTLAADGLNTDLQASAQYRAHLIPVLASRAVAAALAPVPTAQVAP